MWKYLSANFTSWAAVKEPTNPHPDKVHYIWKEASALLFGRYLRPAVRAALFGAMSRIANVTVAHHVADAAGRRGIAITVTDQTYNEQLIFDPDTYVYLGSRGWWHQDGKLVTNATAVTRSGFVDKVGQLP